MECDDESHSFYFNPKNIKIMMIMSVLLSVAITFYILIVTGKIKKVEK